jgi:hypothetical protein
MPSGRGRTLAAVVAALVFGALTTVAADAAVPPINGLAGGKFKVIFQKARVVSDGFVTPGQLETIGVSQMPPRTNFRVVVEAPPTTPQCGEKYFCDPAPTSPAPGTPAYRTSGKGRALVSFVMPSQYYLETDPFRPAQRTPVDFANGQSVHIDVEGARTRKHKRQRIEAFGFARAVVQLPSS